MLSAGVLTVSLLILIVIVLYKALPCPYVVLVVRAWVSHYKVSVILVKKQKNFLRYVPRMARARRTCVIIRISGIRFFVEH